MDTIVSGRYRQIKTGSPDAYVRRAAVTVSVAWPEHALGDLAGFVRELLK